MNKRIMVLCMVVTLVVTSCVSLLRPNTPVLEDNKAIIENPDTQVERTINKVGNWMDWLATVSVVVAIVALGLSLKFPGALHIAGIAGITSVSSFATLLALPWLYAVGWILLVAVVCWGLWWAVGMVQDYREQLDHKEGIISEVCKHFDDPEGRKHLSPDADNALVNHTGPERKPVKLEHRKVKAKVTNETKTS